MQDVGGNVIGGGTSITVTVSWRTALPVREAVARGKYGDEAGTSAEAKKLVEQEQKYYAILVTGPPARGGRGGDRMKESMLKGTSLIVKGRDPIVPSDIQSGSDEKRMLVLFLFPKDNPITADDKEVEFSSKIGPLVIKQKFHLKEMVLNGKLEL